MTIRSLPAAPVGRPCAGVSFDLMPQAMERWNSTIQAADEDAKNTISMLDAIGFDPWSGRGYRQADLGRATQHEWRRCDCEHELARR